MLFRSHIDIRFHFIRWIVGDGKIDLQYCPTEDMKADILTKALPSPKAKHFAIALGLRPSNFPCFAFCGGVLEYRFAKRLRSRPMFSRVSPFLFLS